MDELEFRRRLFADPNSKAEDLNDAKQSDPAKAKFGQDIEKLEQRITNALEVPVPEGLCEKLILRQTLASHQQTKRKTRIHLAMAASVAFAIGLTVNFLQFSSTFTNIGDYALAHVNHEAQYFSNEDEARVTLASLNKKMSTFEGSFIGELGELIFADYCRFDGMNSLHLVFKGETSPVTVFIIPQNEHLSFSEHFSDSQLNGKAIEFEGANIIIVGDQSESIEQWQKTIDSKVRWST